MSGKKVKARRKTEGQVTINVPTATANKAVSAGRVVALLALALVVGAGGYYFGVVGFSSLFTAGATGWMAFGRR